MALFQRILDTELLKRAYYYYPIYVCLLIIFATYLLKKFDRNKFLRQGIPGLKLNWCNIMGHVSILVHQPMFREIYSMNTYFLIFLDGMRKLFPNDSMFCVWVANRRYIVLHKADAFEELLKSTTHIEKSHAYIKLQTWLGTGLLTSKGLKWKSRRKLLTPSFHFDILKDFLPILNEKTDILVQILAEATNEEWIDIVHPITLCSLDIICETTLGVNIDAQKNGNSEYVEAVSRATAMTMERLFNPAMLFDFIFFASKVGQQYRKDLDILHGFTRNVIQQKKKDFKMNQDSSQSTVQRKRKALMDLLLDHHMNNQDFTEEDIREEVDTFAFEGHDTSSVALSWCLYLVGLHPEVQQKIHDELDKIFYDDCRHVTIDDLRDMKYLECVIKEAQRLYPSVPIIARRINEDFTICGRRIERGSECSVFVYGLHRDPNVFPNPEIFDPGRFFPENSTGRHPYAYVPFSAGPRNCIGQRFAMMELKVVLASVLKRYTVLSLEQRDKVLPAADIVLRPGHIVKIKVMPREEIK